MWCARWEFAWVTAAVVAPGWGFAFEVAFVVMARAVVGEVRAVAAAAR